jgi:hypothetical protein
MPEARLLEMKTPDSNTPGGDAGPACGGDPSAAELTIRIFNALRELRVTSLLIDHVAKNQSARIRSKNQIEGGKPSPYGSIYKGNLARSVWQIKQGERREDMVTSAGLYHRKANLGPLRRPLGLTMRFTSDANEQLTDMQFDSFSVVQDSDLSRELPVRVRIAVTVRTGAKTAQAIAEELDIEVDQVRARLNDLRKQGKVVKVGDEWGNAAHQSVQCVRTCLLTGIHTPLCVYIGVYDPKYGKTEASSMTAPPTAPSIVASRAACSVK